MSRRMRIRQGVVQPQRYPNEAGQYDSSLLIFFHEPVIEAVKRVWICLPVESDLFERRDVAGFRAAENGPIRIGKLSSIASITQFTFQ